MASGMMTGKVHRLIDNDLSVRDFLLHAVRETMLCITLRDDDPGPAPRELQPSSFYVALPAKAQAEFDSLAAMSDDEREAYGRERIVAERQRMIGALAQREAEAVKLGETIIGLSGWTAPEPLTKWREDLIDELRTARDGAGRNEFYTNRLDELTHASPMVRWESDLANARDEVARATRERDDELARTADRNRWLAAFYDSLPADDSLRSESAP